MEAGAHVFVEKPLAETVESAQQVVDTAKRTGRKLVIGYILRQHPSWIKFIEIARQLGTPLVFRMNLNQQSNGETWEWHKRLMDSFPPIVDCGVHYVDVMCQMTQAKPIRVQALGARLTDEVPVYNYGMLQVAFDDGSVGWYEAGWGPMMSETAFFVKDVIGPKGSVSIVMAENAGDVKSDDINAHTKTNQILWHHTDMTKPDERIDMTDEPDHDALCEREQRYLLKAIDEDIDLSDHMNDGVKSLRIVMAADESVRTGSVVKSRRRPGPIRSRLRGSRKQRSAKFRFKVPPGNPRTLRAGNPGPALEPRTAEPCSLTTSAQATAVRLEPDEAAEGGTPGLTPIRQQNPTINRGFPRRLEGAHPGPTVFHTGRRARLKVSPREGMGESGRA